jgi:hypothetical protein
MRTVIKSVPKNRTAAALRDGIDLWRSIGSSSDIRLAVPFRQRRPILTRTRESASM